MEMDTAETIALFIAECLQMAKENWSNDQEKMLQRLFVAVLHCKKYDSEEVDKIMEGEKYEEI